MTTRRTNPPRAKPASGKRLRTTLDWERDDPVFNDLNDLKARARGKRVRTLCRLGLIAEEHGVRLDADGRLVLPNALPAVTSALAPVATPAASPPAPMPGPTRSLDQALKLDEDQSGKQDRALDSLAANLLGDFF